jgi:cytochrome c oxidase subunit 2
LGGWLPQAASSFAPELDRLLLIITGIVGAWLAAAELCLVTLVVRYRRRPGRRAAYQPATHLRALSVVLVPCAAILVFDLVIDALSAPVWEEIKLARPAPEELVRIQGEQWAWRFTHAGPDGALDTADDVETVGELHLPRDRVVVFELRAKDVLHALWIPELRLKQDAVPGRTIRGWFRPTREGRFEVVCAEICGFAHTLMKGSLTVESQDSFRAWLAGQAFARAAAGREPEA